MSFEFICKHYGVPAARGRRVTCEGKPGIIIGAEGKYVRVVLDGEAHDGLYHPTWQMTYGDMGELPPVAKQWRCLPPWRTDWLTESFTVMAATRSKARYRAYLDLLDVCDMDAKAMLDIKVRAA